MLNSSKKLNMCHINVYSLERMYVYFYLENQQNMGAFKLSYNAKHHMSLPVSVNVMYYRFKTYFPATVPLSEASVVLHASLQMFTV